AEHRAIVEADMQLARTLDAEPGVIESRDTARAIIQFAQSHQITQIFLGRSGHSRWAELLQRSVINELVRLAEGIDAHIVADRQRCLGSADSGEVLGVGAAPGSAGVPARMSGPKRAGTPALPGRAGASPRTSPESAVEELSMAPNMCMERSLWY